MDFQRDFQTPPPAGGFGANPGPTAFGPMNARAFQVSSDRLAVISLVLGALALPMSLCLILGVPLGIGAIVVSAAARRKIELQPDLFHGAKTAKTGFWFGVVGLVISGLYIVANVAAACFAGSF